jgi:RNA polymerase sigma-70 factor (TIGR02960 family)
VSTNLIGRARAGDGAAFEQLIAPYQRELQVHCYRMLGSVQDAEDAVQETLLAAWRGLDRFEERASLRTWLYRVATSRCLNARRSASRRPAMTRPRDVDPPEPTRLGEVVWLEPYPDVQLEGLADAAPGPEARYEAREAISLAFVSALQLLPPRQRAVLILRDVLGFAAAEVADLLDTTSESVTSALKRARATLQRQQAAPGGVEAPPPSHSATERQVLARLVTAFENGDVDGLATLLTDDVWLRMPPVPFEYQGRDLARRFLSSAAFRQGRRYRLIPTRANGQPAFGLYLVDPATGTANAIGLLVVTLAGDQISAITRFENGLLPSFGLPRTL